MPVVRHMQIADKDGNKITEDIVPADSALSGGVVLDKDPGVGIKVDPASPVYPWFDLLGKIHADIGANSPPWNPYVGNMRQPQMEDGKEVFLEFHFPHDYVPGSDVFLHFHWSQNVVDTGGPGGVPGDVKWQYEVLHAKGHNQAAFQANAIVGSAVDTASGTVRQHLITEFQLSAQSPGAGQIDTDDLEPDVLLLVRIWRDADAAEDTLNEDPFLHECDIHYQSTGIGTKNKAPDFWT